ncbi:glycine--tRNA ligase subunit beta [Anthocerotibacter panamensis]|uniref:glycine--tRNA ligase subunit beta n=1 Tax=Anthocerotibacter panamensis TaxID=2857077 RepID=UPI001C405C08|nr:glycine--tRNA ligase subunit beta [Anthocerotibacter panamensis]
MVNFLLEVGTEELPASFIVQALPQWEEKVRQSLTEQGLSYQEAHFWATPRRLAMVLKGLPDAQADRVDQVKGPAAASAYDAAGSPTKALQGFMRAKGVTPADLRSQATEKGDFIFAQVATQGRTTGALLQDLVPGWITGLEGKRLMRWADGSLRFSRPIRWLVSLLDGQVLPVALEGLQSGATSYGHRVLHPQPLTLTGADTYETELKAAFVWVDPTSRYAHIEALLRQAAQELGAEPEIPADLLTEVNYLVEWPTVVVGSFEADFLTLPPPVIKTEMMSHQRYFPVHQPSQPSALLPYFLSVSNGDPRHSPLIARGNSRVLSARLWDGRFFYNEDRKKRLEDFLANLEAVTFQEKLGSMAERVERIVQVSAWLADHLGFSEAEKLLIVKTTRLSKADLTTQMVKEFPELQGIMGYYYAMADEEDPLIARGIEEHYLPRFAGDGLPTTTTGQIAALADKAELVASMFSIDKIPTGSSDPFGLRRAVLGIIQIIWENKFELSLWTLFAQAGKKLVHAQANLGALKKFYQQRLEIFLIEQAKIDYDLVAAVVDPSILEGVEVAESSLTSIMRRAYLLQKLRQDGTLAEIYETVTRVSRLGAGSGLSPMDLDPRRLVSPNHFQTPVEKTLFDVACNSSEVIALDNSSGSSDKFAEVDLTKLVEHIKDTVEPVTQFFIDVLVMAEDPDLRTNRLNVLGVLRNQYRLLADFSKVVMGGQ